MGSLTRRDALIRVAAIGGALSLSSLVPPALLAEDNQLSDQQLSVYPLPSPQDSGIQHVVVMMMENRSFDHFLGWLPNADGKQAGLSYPDRNGVLQPTHPMAPDYQGCGFNDPDHSYEGGRVEYDAGRCDGWLRAGKNDIYSIGYYTQPDLAFLVRSRRATRHRTTTSPLSSDQRSRTASTNTLVKQTG